MLLKIVIAVVQVTKKNIDAIILAVKKFRKNLEIKFKNKVMELGDSDTKVMACKNYRYSKI